MNKSLDQAKFILPNSIYSILTKPHQRVLLLVKHSSSITHTDQTMNNRVMSMKHCQNDIHSHGFASTPFSTFNSIFLW